jgi:uncharacterized membrane protein YhaH (DUF805 family)
MLMFSSIASLLFVFVKNGDFTQYNILVIVLIIYIYYIFSLGLSAAIIKKNAELHDILTEDEKRRIKSSGYLKVTYWIFLISVLFPPFQVIFGTTGSFDAVFILMILGLGFVTSADGAAVRFSEAQQ